MKVTNATIAQTLRQYASILNLQGTDRFKTKAYERAAKTIESLEVSAAQLVSAGSDLTEFPGIGKAISGAIQEIVKTGTLTRLQQMTASIPAETLELSSKPRLDPRRVARIYKKLGIRNLKELEENLRTGTIRDVFGARMEFHIRQGLDVRPRHLLWSIRGIVEQIEAFLRKSPRVTNVCVTGSVRRKSETVGDLNFLVTGKQPDPIFKAFEKFGSVHSVELTSDSVATFKLSSGIDVTLKWTPQSEWGVSLVESTGNAAHVEQLSRAAMTAKAQEAGNFSQESSIYAAAGLPWIEPELREGRGEIEAALRGQLPVLVNRADVRGDLHMHSTSSDGANSIEEMAKAARELGYEYIAITDHSQSLRIANGLDEKRLEEQLERIDVLNEGLHGIRILKSAEVDILQDGSLDYSNKLLKKLDLTVCSIHSRFAMDKTQQTERIMRAMDNPHFNILGHATGRLLLSREGYELDIERVLKHARQTGCFVEINSSPNRLDLSDINAKLAKDIGVMVAVNTDAHSTKELQLIEAGINQARRGWLSKEDVLNCRSIEKLLSSLKR